MTNFITTPIYYTNGDPHIGHAYTTIVADALARWSRLQGQDVFFLTGTDEHGEPIARAAKQLGIPPQQLVDKYAVEFSRLTQEANASNDFFIRTSDPRHKQRVVQLLQSLKDRDLVYLSHYSGWYCERCADFITQRNVTDDYTCPVHHIPLEKEEQENWFFRLSLFADRLKQYFKDNPNFIWPQSRYNEAKKLLENGLEDVSISRPGHTWGIKVPWDNDQVFYVWFDALLNYITAPQIASKQGLTPNTQIIGKDILKFHAVFWPALLWALEKEIPSSLLVHGHILNKGEKISKSLGNTIDPFEIVNKFGSDALRWTLFTKIPFGEDGSLQGETSFSEAKNELADVYGNLQRRVWKLALKHYPNGLEINSTQKTEPKYTQFFTNGKVSEAAKFAFQETQNTNQSVQQKEPWKNPETIPSLVAEVLHCTNLLEPFIPQAAQKVRNSVSYKNQKIVLTDIPILFKK